MKKVIIIASLLFAGLLLVGCDLDEMTAREAVVEYLDMYRSQDPDLIEQLDEYVDEEDLTDEQKQEYKKIIEKEYSSLTYDIVNEKYEGDIAYITTKITVIDLYKAQTDAVNYFNDHNEEFNDDEGNYDKEKFMDYKLQKMKEASDLIVYTIDFKVVKDGDDWKVSQLSNDDLEKIHGIYSYEE